MIARHDFAGEFIGTFLLVFFCCSSVAVTVLFSAHVGLFQIATVQGLSVTLSIYATRYLSCAHLNPAVSIAMVIGRRMSAVRLPAYLIAQFAGAFAAAAVLYLIFGDSITRFEQIHGIVRGAPESVRTAMIFGEFYPNPGAGATASVSMLTAMLTEGIGTFALVFFIFSLTEDCNLGRPDGMIAPLFIGIAVALIVSVTAPLTQTGLNPARDFSPRLFSMLQGWHRAAFSGEWYGSLAVYIAGPLAGAGLASLLFTRIVEPLMKSKKETDTGKCDTGHPAKRQEL
ncbi:MAG: aquaporin [Alphaproteobacteria bacterium]|uniref:Aquaporin n=1 Tax=Candidatus Nitrobium versatile TaxID=2884831 RepID=A0A953JA74_9BACT|nr:aquaporin [Candidatus Nitrobium versatile]